MLRLINFLSLKTASKFAGCFTLIVFFSFSPSLHGKDETTEQRLTRKKLENIQAKIKQKNNLIASDTTELSKIETRLQSTDNQINQTTRQLKASQTKLQSIKNKLTVLEEEQEQLLQEKTLQAKALAEQVKSAYQIGEHDYLMMLLNQESPAKLERMLAYYQYFNKARIQQLENFKLILSKLNNIEVELTNKRHEVESILLSQQQQESELKDLKQQQKHELAKLSSKLKSEKANLKRLKNSEQSLTSLLEELAKAVAELPSSNDLVGLKKYKGKLPWPSKGKVQTLFGKRKRGPLRWKGIIIDGKLGASVKTIQAGQIIFADWMKGFGLVMVIDHGDGYMSLYGHNQTLLKDAGDMVEAGETVALVGQSGGQSSPNVYFEIRHQGQPLNPKHWCKR